MPEEATRKRAQADKRAGKSASTQAGEYVREEIEHVREGKHGARSPEQAIAIGLSKARRDGVKVPPPKKGRAYEATRKQARRDSAKAKSRAKTSTTRSKATKKALKREGHKAASSKALGEHARKAARKRTAAERSASAKKAAASRTAAQRSASAKKAARTRARNKS